ncbi:hypothetical protein [Streptomyces sp. NPDC020983]|uniref:hypothetical protein n=1 Tax=Streptomyces sp. NPDC020983 TaxID=3365106 RepID=UPI00379F7931
MTISYSAAGALSSAASTITPAYPATPTVGQLLVLVVTSGHTDDPTPSTPSGWTLVDSTSGGGGTFGAGTGPRRLTWFVRVAVGGDAAPTTAIPSGSSGSVVSGRIHVLARSAGTGWRWAVSVGADTSSGTGFSAVGGSALTWAAGDMALLGYALNASTASLTAEAVAATGITYGTVTERADDAVATGDAARRALATCAVSSGAGTQTPTITATLAAAATGVAGVLRVREASATISAAAQTTFPPRNLVTVSGLSADDIVTASIYQVVGDTRTAVRAGTSVDVGGHDVVLRVDAEQPLGVPIAYAADLVDVNGDVWTVTTTSSITSTVGGDVISDAVQGIGALCVIEAGWEKTRSRDASTSNIAGRLITVSRRRGGATATITVRTESDAESDAMHQVLQGATEGVLQIRKQVTMSRVDGYYAITDDTERPHWYDEYTWWDLTTAESTSWPAGLEATGFTLADLAAVFPGTLGDLAAAFSGQTLLDLAQYDFGA